MTPVAKTKRLGDNRHMPDFAWVLIVIAAYIALQRWVLPAIGIQT